MSPTQRTLKLLREAGDVVEITERWNPHSRTRHDLFGMFDLLSMDEHGQLVGVQCCAGASHAARKAKLLSNPLLLRWKRRHCAAIVSWSKTGKRGARKLWTPRIEAL